MDDQVPRWQYSDALCHCGERVLNRESEFSNE